MKNHDHIQSFHTCLVVKNQLWNDARVKKEALSLRNAGFRVTIISKPENDLPEHDIWQNITVIRSPYHSRFRAQLRNRIISLQNDEKKPGMLRKFLNSIRQNRIRRFFTDLKRNLQYEFRLISAAEHVQADIYQANDLDTLFICWKAARKNQARLVYDSHELWLESVRYLTGTDFLNRLRYKLTERFLVKKVDAVIAVTPCRAEKMSRMYPGMVKPAVVENSPVPINSSLKSNWLREHLSLPGNTTIALYQGILADDRGLEELLTAALQLEKTDVAVVLIGHDSTDGRIEKTAGNMPLDGKVFFLPPVPSEKLSEITVSADMGFVLFQNTCLNNYYSLPNKLYEYMIAGIPVIASDFPEIARVVRENKCGILIDPSDPQKISDAIITLVNDAALRKEMGRNGRKAVLEKYNWFEQEKVLLKTYRQVTGP